MKNAVRSIALLIASIVIIAITASAQTPTLQCGNAPCGSAQPNNASASSPRSSAPAASSGSLAVFNKYSIAGDYVASGVGVRGSGVGTIVVQGVPSGATVVAAFLYWETLGDGQNASFNGQAITGAALGTTVSPCWPEPTITVYRADVLSLVTQAGNGSYPVQFPDSGNPLVAPSTEGASLVVVFKKDGLSNKTILLYDGAVTIPFDGHSVDGSSFSTTITGFGPAPSTPKARITYMVGDGQGFPSELFFNGTIIGNNVFTGSSGPLWDNLSFDVSNSVPSGATQVTTSSPILSDCLTFGALVFAIDEECSTDVTRESQGDPRWATDLYDHSNTVTIKQQGCAMTSLSMALNNAGINNDPGSLNTFMAATDTDYSGLAVNWGPATRDASANTLKFHAQRIDSTVDLQGAKQYLDTNVCQQHHPVIVGVDLDANGTPGHYVIVTGKKNNDYTIADPGFARTALSQYNNEFVTRGFVADPPGDLSELDLAIGDVAETLVTDPSGRETGFDPTLQEIVEQIPTSAYFRDSLQDDVSGAPPTEIDHLTEVFQPSQGTYQIVVNGLKLGTYSLSLRMFSQDGSSQPGVLIAGIAGPDSNSAFSIQLTSTPGSTPTVTVVASFSNTLADINNSLQLGLIDNHGIANSLSQKIEAAQAATVDTRNNILNAFINEVNAQSGKHIKGLAVQVLLADAKALTVH